MWLFDRLDLLVFFFRIFIFIFQEGWLVNNKWPESASAKWVDLTWPLAIYLTGDLPFPGWVIVWEEQFWSGSDKKTVLLLFIIKNEALGFLHKRDNIVFFMYDGNTKKNHFRTYYYFIRLEFVIILFLYEKYWNFRIST